jgi:hypothetical protein
MMLKKDSVEIVAEVLSEVLEQEIKIHDVFVRARNVWNTYRNVTHVSERMFQVDWTTYQSLGTIPSYVWEFCDRMEARYDDHFRAVRPYKVKEEPL